MKHESTSKAALFETNSQILLILYSSSMFFYVFLKHKRDMRLTYLLIIFVFLQIHLDSPSRQKIYLKIKFSNKIQFFTLEFIHIWNDLISFRFNYLCKFHTIPKLKRITNVFFAYCLFGNLSLNPGPVYNNQSLHSNEWNVFRSGGIHLVNLNVNNLLPKVDEIHYIAERTKAPVIGITESKLDKFIFRSEIQIDNYDLLQCDRNKNGGGFPSNIRVILVTCRKTFSANVIEALALKFCCLKSHL